MVPKNNGEQQTLCTKCPDVNWHKWIEKLEQRDEPYLFYDPFDHPEYTWLSWYQINQDLMTRLIGEPFAAGDFIPFTADSRTPKLPIAGQLPVKWGIMF